MQNELVESSTLYMHIGQFWIVLYNHMLLEWNMLYKENA